jgi:hypothetical protein
MLSKFTVFAVKLEVPKGRRRLPEGLFLEVARPCLQYYLHRWEDCCCDLLNYCNVGYR